MSKNKLWHLPLIIIGLIALLPVIFMISNSFKTLQESYRSILSIIPLHPTLSNYHTLDRQINILQIIWNTFFIATIVTLGKLLTGFLSAIAFRYYSFRGKRILYFIFISTIFIPFTVMMLPNYLIISKLHLLSSVIGVVLPQLCDAKATMLFLKSLEKIPNSLIEAARVEDIPTHKILSNIILPIIKPNIISLGSLFFINLGMSMYGQL